MSAAQTEIDVLAERVRAEEADIARDKATKSRNISRRVVVNLPDDIGFFLRHHFRDIGAADSVPSSIRILIMEALRARGYTREELRADYREEVARLAHEAAAAARIEADKVKG